MSGFFFNQEIFSVGNSPVLLVSYRIYGKGRPVRDLAFSLAHPAYAEARTSGPFREADLRNITPLDALILMTYRFLYLLPCGYRRFVVHSLGEERRRAKRRDRTGIAVKMEGK